MRRFLMIPALVVLASAAMYTGACGGDEGGEASGGAPSGAPDIEGVIYEADANDEALIALLGVTPRSDASQAVVFDTPEDGAMLPGDAAPKLSWHVGGTALLGAPRRGGAPAPTALPAGRGELSGWGALRELLGPVRAAGAHGAPVNGRAYLLVFSTADREALLRVFTTRLDYTPDAAAWETLRSAGAPITVTVLNALFENNRIAQGGGPFAGEPVTFSIQR